MKSPRPGLPLRSSAFESHGPRASLETADGSGKDFLWARRPGCGFPAHAARWRAALPHRTASAGSWPGGMHRKASPLTAPSPFPSLRSSEAEVVGPHASAQLREGCVSPPAPLCSQGRSCPDPKLTHAWERRGPRSLLSAGSGRGAGTSWPAGPRGTRTHSARPAASLTRRTGTRFCVCRRRQRRPSEPTGRSPQAPPPTGSPPGCEDRIRTPVRRPLPSSSAVFSEKRSRELVSARTPPRRSGPRTPEKRSSAPNRRPEAAAEGKTAGPRGPSGARPPRRGSRQTLALQCGTQGLGHSSPRDGGQAEPRPAGPTCPLARAGEDLRSAG